MLKSQRGAAQAGERIDRDAESAADFQWLSEHEAELLASHRGQWIAVWRQKVIAAGVDLVEVCARADQVAPSDEYTLHKLEPIAAELF